MPQPVDDKHASASLYPKGGAIQNEYTLEPGVCILPLAQQPPTNAGELLTWSPVVKLQLHAPYRIRKFRYDTEKTNNPPVLPAPADTGAFVFTGGSIYFHAGLNATFSNFDWTTTVQYTFIENCVSRTQDGFVLGSPPWTTDMDVENAGQYSSGGVGGNNTTTLGAVRSAGREAKTGYVMGQSIIPALSSTSAAGWGYNQPQFFPGTLFNDKLANGGQQ